jgi:phage terminase small subunit
MSAMLRTPEINLYIERQNIEDEDKIRELQALQMNPEITFDQRHDLFDQELDIRAALYQRTMLYPYENDATEQIRVDQHGIGGRIGMFLSRIIHPRIIQH